MEAALRAQREHETVPQKVSCLQDEPTVLTNREDSGSRPGRGRSSQTIVDV